MRRLAALTVPVLLCGCFGSRPASPPTRPSPPSRPQPQARTAPANPVSRPEPAVKVDKKALPEFGDVPFESEGVGEASKFERLLDAQQRAEQDALTRAMQEIGVDVYYGFSDLLAQSGSKETQMVSRYISTFSRGAASWKRLSEPECATSASGTIECRVRISGKVSLRGKPDPSFDIILNDRGLGLSHPAYRNGESVELALRVSRDAAVYVFSVDEELNAYLVVPNQNWKGNRVKAGETFRYPPKDGELSLIAALPEGKDRATEVLHIIATKDSPLIAVEGLSEKEVGPYKALSAGTLGQVMSKLTQLDRDKWTMAVLPYEIQR